MVAMGGRRMRRRWWWVPLVESDHAAFLEDGDGGLPQAELRCGEARSRALHLQAHLEQVHRVRALTAQAWGRNDYLKINNKIKTI